MMKIIDENLLNQITLQAEESPRLRMNYNFHESETDPINRLLNVINLGSYVHPHRHMNPDKQEIFLVLKGCLNVYIFDDNGNVTEKIEVSPSKGVYGMEIPPHNWHSVIAMEQGTVIYEVKQGPFEPLSPENFAPWAPFASDHEGANLYMESLLRL